MFNLSKKTEKIKKVFIAITVFVLFTSNVLAGMDANAAENNILLTNNQNYVKHFSSAKNGCFLVRFKFNLEDETSVIRMAFLGTKTANFFTGYDTFLEVMRTDSGTIGTGVELNDYRITNKKSILHGVDNSVDVWLDMDNRIINYYLNGEYWATIKVTDTFKEFWGYVFSARNSNDKETAVTVKDFEIIKYVYGVNFGDSIIPEYLKQTPCAYYTTENVGNIFKNPSEPIFKELLLNRENKAVSFENTVSVYDEDGNKIFEQIKDTELSAVAKQTSNLKIDLTKAEKQYGIFKMKSVFKNKDTNEVTSESVTNFSVIKSPSDANKKLGINVHFGHYQGDPYTNMNIIKDVGFSSARDFVDYASYNGKIGFTRYDSWQGYAKEYGIDRTVILMGYDSDTYGGVFPTTEEGRKNYTEYAAGAAKHLNGDAAVLELWNEMDWRTSAENYAQMLIDTVPAVKEVNDTAKIAVMCTARTKQTERIWIEKVINYIKSQNLNPRDYMDIVSVHPYTRNNMPEADGCECGMENDTVGNLKNGVEEIRKILDSAGLEDVKLFATEMGFYSTDNAADTGGWNGGKHHDALSERQQAEYSVRTTALLYNSLDHMEFYVINDNGDASATEKGFGITKTYMGIELPYEAKPVYAAFAAFNSILGNFKITEENEVDDCYDYVFEKDNETIHLMWTINAQSVYSYRTDSACAECYDIYGNKSYLKGDGKEIKINLSGSPIYVKELDFAVIDNRDKEVSEKSLTASAYASAYASADTDEATLIMAAYKDGRLTDIALKKINENGFAKTEAINVSEADFTKAFLLSDCRPIKSMIKNKVNGGREQ